LENQPNVVGSGPTWLFDIDTLTQSMNYQPVVVGNQPSCSVDPLNTDADASCDDKETESEVHVSPRVRNLNDEFKEFTINNTNGVNVASTPVTAVGPNSTNSTNSFNAVGPSDNVVSLNFEIGRKSSFVDPSQYPDDPNMPALEDIVYSDDKEDVGVEADFSNLETTGKGQGHMGRSGSSFWNSSCVLQVHRKGNGVGWFLAGKSVKWLGKGKGTWEGRVVAFGTVPMCCRGMTFDHNKFHYKVRILSCSPMVTLKSITRGGYFTSPENPTNGILDSLSFALVSGPKFLKQYSYMSSEELPPSTYIMRAWKPSIYACRTMPPTISMVLPFLWSRETVSSKFPELFILLYPYLTIRTMVVVYLWREDRRPRHSAVLVDLIVALLWPFCRVFSYIAKVPCLTNVGAIDSEPELSKEDGAFLSN
nr:hypothetical protein [Tanacetum cinerariifolium]